MKMRERLFGISWRLALLTLPWQTRWFHDASLAGWPWEQGRWSVYASMILIVATIVLGFRPLQKRDRSWIWLMPCGLIILTLITTLSRTATMQWWVQAVLLGGFAWTILRKGIPREKLAFWSVMSLAPHVLIGFFQYAYQRSPAMSLLGMASHDPRDLGVSVVEFGIFRYLRIYGGFPHPNIFGGWLAMGIAAVCWLASHARSNIIALAYAGYASLLGIALVLTFSRSAWIAALVGLAVLFVMLVRERLREPLRSQFGLLAVVCTLISVAAAVAMQYPVVASRFNAQDRLEEKSLEVRSASLQEGMNVFLRHPWFGTGPNAELVALASAEKTPEPLEPPHNAFLLLLDDLGIIGTFLAVYGIWSLRRLVTRESLPFFAIMLVIASVDHYPWSAWSGMCLVLLLSLFFSPSAE